MTVTEGRLDEIVIERVLGEGVISKKTNLLTPSKKLDALYPPVTSG